MSNSVNEKKATKTVSVSKKQTQKVPETSTEKVVEKIAGEVIDSPKSPVSFNSDEASSYKKACDNISNEMRKVNTSYLEIAKDVHYIYRNKLFRIDNYPSIYDFAEKVYSFSRATCNNYINICEKFGMIDKETGRCTGLLPEYKDFNSSQLIAMIPLENNELITDELRQQIRSQISSDMPVREIRRRYKFDLERLEEKGQLPEQSEASKKGKRKKLELLKSSNINEVIESSKDILIRKFEEFEQTHPDIAYDIAVTLSYKE